VLAALRAMRMSLPDTLILWAKLDESAGGVQTYHPLLAHLIDVAAVANALWHRTLTPAARRRMARALGLDEEAAARWVAFLAGLHDLGKASPVFQHQDERAASRLRAAGWPGPPPMARVPHGDITTACLKRLLPRFGAAPAVVQLGAEAVGSHHGILVKSRRLDPEAVGTGVWGAARDALVSRLAELLGVVPAPAPASLDGTTALVLAGLTSVADWIGSNTDYFPHAVADAAGPVTFEHHVYWGRACEGAQRALAELGWAGRLPGAPPPRTFTASFPDLAPRLLQLAVAGLAERLQGPGLLIIEAPMGEGKTEAALHLAERWNASLEQRGFYVALPTQATSDQMFGRVRDFLAGAYPESIVNLQLLHGHAALSAEFEALRLNGNRVFRPSGIDPAGDSTDGMAHVAAAEWFTYRKRGLLAPFGVGTVDQALMAVLQSRHVFVRLFGLAHKIVVLDEVHAYDTYMTTLIERLLEWLAALGSPVVLLSATLPAARREALACAYARGLGRESLPEAVPPAYPRVTWVTVADDGTEHVDASPAFTRALGLERLILREGGPQLGAWTLGPRLKEALAAGGCAAVVCNTVGEAQEAYRHLRAVFPGLADDGLPEVDLLHARYPFEERERRQQRTLVRFGKPDGVVHVGDGNVRPVRRPSRAILVATQVIEQSLDLDFDLMVSELAPVDLLLQRAGRLHRHSRHRAPALLEPRLWIGWPPVSEDETPMFGKGTEAVYDRHVLLRTWLAMADLTSVRIPEDIDGLIDLVYGDVTRACPWTASESLNRAWDESLRELLEAREREQQEARARWLRPPGVEGPLSWFAEDPREEDAPELHREHQALTRLAELSVGVVLLHGSPERPALGPDGRETVSLTSEPSLELAKRLLRRSVSVADRRVVGPLLHMPAPAAWRRSPWLRHHRLLVLGLDGAVAVGRHSIRLDDELGLVITAREDMTT
jgi:CRISPR-associated endonuclease/helicase Cas3